MIVSPRRGGRRGRKLATVSGERTHEDGRNRAKPRSAADSALNPSPARRMVDSAAAEGARPARRAPRRRIVFTRHALPRFRPVNHVRRPGRHRQSGPTRARAVLGRRTGRAVRKWWSPTSRQHRPTPARGWELVSPAYARLITIRSWPLRYRLPAAPLGRPGHGLPRWRSAPTWSPAATAPSPPDGLGGFRLRPRGPPPDGRTPPRAPESPAFRTGCAVGAAPGHAQRHEQRRVAGLVSSRPGRPQEKREASPRLA